LRVTEVTEHPALGRIEHTDRWSQNALIRHFSHSDLNNSVKISVANVSFHHIPYLGSPLGDFYP